MANEALIKGEALVRKTQGFQNTAASFGAGFDKGADARREKVAAEEKKVADIQNRVNSNMSNMKTGMDLTDLSVEQKKATKSFLLERRNEYAEAANAIAKIGDATDPDYQYYADIMNNVNNSFVNLKSQLNSYKENKVQYAADIQKRIFSGSSTNMVPIEDFTSIYGLDKEIPGAPMFISPDGNLNFNKDGRQLVYNDMEPPVLKDYKLADVITGTANSIFTKGLRLNKESRNAYKIDLKMALRDPAALKSILSTDFSEEGLDFTSITYNPDDLQGTEDALINQIMNAWDETANQGYAEKQRIQAANRKSSFNAASYLTPDNINYHTPIIGRGGTTLFWDDSALPPGYVREDDKTGLPLPGEAYSIDGGERGIGITNPGTLRALAK